MNRSVWAFGRGDKTTSSSSFIPPKHPKAREKSPPCSVIIFSFLVAKTEPLKPCAGNWGVASLIHAVPFTVPAKRFRFVWNPQKRLFLWFWKGKKGQLGRRKGCSVVIVHWCFFCVTNISFVILGFAYFFFVTDPQNVFPISRIFCIFICVPSWTFLLFQRVFAIERTWTMCVCLDLWTFMLGLVATKYSFWTTWCRWFIQCHNLFLFPSYRGQWNTSPFYSIQIRMNRRVSLSAVRGTQITDRKKLVSISSVEKSVRDVGSRQVLGRSPGEEEKLSQHVKTNAPGFERRGTDCQEKERKPCLTWSGAYSTPAGSPNAAFSSCNQASCLLFNF